MKKQLVAFAALFTVTMLTAQDRQDKGGMKPYVNPFMKNIKQKMSDFRGDGKNEGKRFMMDYTGVDVPKSMSEFKTVYTSPTISQGLTNTCWCFSTLSFFETEVQRITKQDVHLSQSYIVYWEYVEKAKEYVRKRGDMFVGEGSESNAVTRMMQMYGVVPYDSYTGLKPNQPFYDHVTLFDEINKYLENVKLTGAWDEETVVRTVKSILKFHMGEIPTTVTIAGKTMSPQQYMTDVLKLNPLNYVELMSLKQSPYWTKAEYNVPDNWWHSEDYYNVPLDVWMNVIKTSIKNGYSLAIGGDVSEGGINPELGVAMVPSYDIPSSAIDENARQLRFSNGTTTDDHAVHLVGWCERKNGMWFLIKDSGSSARNNPQNPGFYYYHEDYVKLKMMTYTVHKDMVKDVLVKFTK
jgi:bleomycin hydrolase